MHAEGNTSDRHRALGIGCKQGLERGASLCAPETCLKNETALFAEHGAAEMLGRFAPRILMRLTAGRQALGRVA